MFETIKEEGQSFMESHTEKNINNIVRQSELSDEQFCSQDLASYLHTQGLQNTLAITQNNSKSKNKFQYDQAREKPSYFLAQD